MLTDLTLRKAKAREKPYKMADAKGLYVIVRPNGAIWWRFDYTLDGKRKTVSLGTYPAVTLEEARRKRDEMREKVAAGTDPSKVKKGGESTDGDGVTFESVVKRWLRIRRDSWARSTAMRIENRIAKDVLPKIGHVPINKVRPADILEIARAIEARGAIETAKRVISEVVPPSWTVWRLS